jgi:hypothetical protein
MAANRDSVCDVHFLAELDEAGIFSELGEERIGLYVKRPDVSHDCFVEGLESLIYLAECGVNENL